MDKVNEILKNKELVNRTEACLTTVARGMFSSVPIVGGALDHLVFDLSSEVRLQNIERCIRYISEQIELIKEERLDKPWFESVDALDLFKRLGLLIETEPDEEKIKVLSEVYVKFGMVENSTSVYKKVILDKIAQMSNCQRVVFLAICKHKNISNSSPSINSAISMLYKSKDPRQSRLSPMSYSPSNIRFKGVPIAEFCEYFEKTNKNGVFISDVKLELQILNDYNLLQQPSGSIDSDKFYQVTELGRQVSAILNTN